MTKYEDLMNKSDECCLKAIDFAKKNIGNKTENDNKKEEKTEK